MLKRMEQFSSRWWEHIVVSLTLEADAILLQGSGKTATGFEGKIATVAHGGRICT